MSQSLKEQCKELVKNQGVNLRSTIEYDVNGEIHSFSLESIIDSMMLGSEKSQEVFFESLKLTLEGKNDLQNTTKMRIQKFFEDMGQLLLMTHLSDKFQD